MPCRPLAVASTLAVLSMSAFLPQHLAAEELQSAQLVLKATDLLPSELLKGENYTVKQDVRNDGLINTYSLDTSFGPLSVESTALLLVRVGELKALARMQKLKESDVYQEGLKRGAKSPLKGAEALIENPVAAVKGAATGFGRWMSDVGRSIASDDPHQANVAETALGQAAAKRAYAYEFRVDPYTGYLPLQKSLDEIAWAAAGGGLTMKVAFSFIPGAAGVVVSATGTTDSMRALVRDKSPVELEKINKGKLKAMGVSDKIAQALHANNAYTPQERTLLVGELDSLAGIKGRDRYIAAAARAEDEAKAVFMRTRAQMIGRFQKETKSGDAFVELDGALFLKTRKGGIVGHFPVDHVAATPGAISKVKAFDAKARALPGVSARQIHFGGTLDPGVRKAFEDAGWSVHEREFVKLAGR